MKTLYLPVLATSLLLLVASCGKDDDQPTPNIQLPPPPLPHFDCGNPSSLPFRMQGLIAIQAGVPANTLAFETYAKSFYLDSLMAQGLWQDSILSVTPVLAVLDFKEETGEYELVEQPCGYDSTCWESQPVLLPRPAVSHVKVTMFNPANMGEYVVLGDADVVGVDSLEIQLDPADVESYFHLNPALEDVKLSVQLSFDNPVHATIPAMLHLGFCLERQ